MKLFILAFLFAYAFAQQAPQPQQTPQATWTSQQMPATNQEVVDEELDDILSDQNQTNNQQTNKGWYTETDQIQFDSTDTTVKLISPVVKDWAWNNITNFKVYYSTKSFTDVDFENIELENINEKEFNDVQINWDKIEFVIENLNPKTKYYFIIEPRTKDWVALNRSKEIEVETKDVQVTHQAASTNEIIKWLTYVISWNKVTVKYEDATWADKIEIYYQEANEAEYKKYDTIKADKKEFDIIISKVWAYNIKLIPLKSDWQIAWQEVRFQVKIDEVTQKVESTPKVWPATNLMLALLILVSIIYLARRYVK